MPRPAPTKKSKTPHRSPDGPIRTCIGCRTRRLATELVRVRCNDGHPVINGAGSGRSAWLCADAACIEHAGHTKGFSRALRSKLSDGLFADTLLGWLGKPPQ